MNREIELEATIEKQLEAIVKKHNLAVAERGGWDDRMRDDKDFIEFFIGSVRRMMKEAYLLGRESK